MARLERTDLVEDVVVAAKVAAATVATVTGAELAEALVASVQ